MALMDELPALPFDRPAVLDLPPLLRRLRAQQPVARVRTPAGDVAWLVTGYDEVRALFADDRLGRSHADPERAPRYAQSSLMGGPMAPDPETERAETTRMRRVLTRSFMVKRMNALRPGIQATLDGLLDRASGLTQPVDLHAELAMPLPVLVICDLLGVPFEDRVQFREWSEDTVRIWDRERAAAGLTALRAYMRDLLAWKRRERAEDVLSDLLAAGEEDPGFADEQMVTLAAGLLFAGHATTMTRIDLGTLLLLTHPEQRRALQDHPSLAPAAVEEILRFAAPGEGVLPRYAAADIEFRGVRIRRGELVLLANNSANHDDDAFPDADRFDIRRDARQHLAFGHGTHFCPGAGLARVELQVVFGTLFRRFPTLRLAVPVEEIRLRGEIISGGLVALPVAW